MHMQVMQVSCLTLLALPPRCPSPQEFSADMNSRPVKRIEDVSILRTSQFSEDNGPMQHPIRPDSYIKMDNFYTVTVRSTGTSLPPNCHLTGT